MTVAPRTSDPSNAPTTAQDGAEPGRPRRSRWSRGKRLLALGAAVVLAAVAFYGGGGWYYAGQIRQQALTVAAHHNIDDVHLSPAGHGLVAVRSLVRSARAISPIH